MKLARTRISLALAAAIAPTLLLGCGNQCSNLGSCPSVDENGGPSDYIIEIAPGGLVSLDSPPTSSLQTTAGGEVVIHPDAAVCVPSKGMPCHATLKRLAIRIVPFTMTLSDGTQVTVDDAVISAQAPLSIEDDDSFYEVPAGTTFQTCASLSGAPEGATATSTSIIYVGFDPIDHSLSVDGSFPMLLHADNSACSPLPMTLSGLVSGQSPWKQTPSP